jgi:hypothetical protein
MFHAEHHVPSRFSSESLDTSALDDLRYFRFVDVFDLVGLDPPCVPHTIGDKGFSMDKPKAFEYALLSCNQGHSWGCANASRMLDIGDGVKQDKAQAEQLRVKAQRLSEGENYQSMSK